MKLDFHEFYIARVGDRIPGTGYGWVTAYLVLLDSETNTRCATEYSVAVRYERTWPIDAIRRAAFEKIRAMAAMDVEVLENHSLGELERWRDEKQG